MITHGNIMANEHMIAGLRSSTTNPRSSSGELPHIHDMGLIGNVLHPLYLNSTSYLMSPSALVRDPLRWLRMISRFRATTSGGPNFAYELCVRRFKPGDAAGLDLSSWNLAFVGAEPVRAETLRRFAETFAPFGFRSSAFYPCYRLAEATLLVSGSKKGEGAVVRPAMPGVRSALVGSGYARMERW